MNDKKIKFKIAPSWHVVEKIRKDIQKKLRGKRAEYAEPVTICASELCENAIKYGIPVQNLSEIQFELELEKDLIRIRVRNGVIKNKDLKKVTDTIDLINQSESTEELYINRLRELMEDPKPGKSQLGLFRIAYETGFSIQYKYNKKILEIIAEKKII